MNMGPRAGVAAMVAFGFLFASQALSDGPAAIRHASFDTVALQDVGINVVCQGCDSSLDDGTIEIVGGAFSLETRTSSYVFDRVNAGSVGLHISSTQLPSFAVLGVEGGKIGFDANNHRILAEGSDLVISQGLAEVLRANGAAGKVIGTITLAVEGAADIDVIDPAARNEGVAGQIGPDVIVGELHNFNNYGTNGTLSAFSVGTTSCNVGDTPLLWQAENNRHPVIGQNMYRLKNGRFEQIGQSWLKHGFLALAENACGLGCQNPNNGALLGVGCSDPYSANLNGQQGNLGPKSEINAHTGFFPYPPSNPQWSGPYARRLQIRNTDLDPAQDGGGKYFVEGQYVAADDAVNGNNNNNASYREITINAGGGGSWNMAFAGPTVRQQAAIRAWRNNDPAVVETDIQVPDDGLYILAAKATHLGDGLWNYEYALQNLNSDRSVGSFSIPTNKTTDLQDIGFHDVDYHSGEPYSGTDWEASQTDSEITWSTDFFGDNPNANALRWGTLYNFRFTTQRVPTTVQVTLGMFKNGGPVEVTAETIGPAFAPVDCNGNSLDDRCDLDCDALGLDICHHMGACGTSFDCDNSGQPDECETDCNGNGLFDACDLNDGSSEDCNANAVPDECDPDWDGDATPDACDGDIDGDGVANAADVCDFTPLGSSIRTNGTVVGDINNDCDVDLIDYNHFDDCGASSGPNDPPNNPACLGLYDYEHDGDLDLGDFAGIVNSFTGS